MVSEHYKSAVGIFFDRKSVEEVLNELNSIGLPMDRISVVAKETERDEQLGGTNMSDSIWYRAQDGTATCAAITGSMLGAIGGCLLGIGLLVVPGVGIVLGVGTSWTALAATIAGAGIGLAGGSLISALGSLGITSDEVSVYSDRVSQAEYLVIVNGTEDEVRRAEPILSRS